MERRRIGVKIFPPKFYYRRKLPRTRVIHFYRFRIRIVLIVLIFRCTTSIFLISVFSLSPLMENPAMRHISQTDDLLDKQFNM